MGQRENVKGNIFKCIALNENENLTYKNCVGVVRAAALRRTF